MQPQKYCFVKLFHQNHCSIKQLLQVLFVSHSAQQTFLVWVVKEHASPDCNLLSFGCATIGIPRGWCQSNRFLGLYPAMVAWRQSSGLITELFVSRWMNPCLGHAYYMVPMDPLSYAVKKMSSLGRPTLKKRILGYIDGSRAVVV